MRHTLPNDPRHTVPVAHVVQREHPEVLTPNLAVSARFICIKFKVVDPPGNFVFTVVLLPFAEVHFQAAKSTSSSSFAVCTRLHIRKSLYVNFLLSKARPDIFLNLFGLVISGCPRHAVSQIMRGNSTGWSNVKRSNLLAGVLPDSFSGPTTFPNSHRLRQGMVGGGGLDCISGLQH